MRRTISFMTGKGSVNHNSRKFHAKNTDPERSYLNIEYCNENIKDVYRELFDEALARYNEKQTRSDRQIDDYYEKIRSGKQEKPFHEIILQIGDKDSMGAKTKNGQLAAKVLDKYMQDFQRRNPTLRVFSAYLHMDEATPHLHIDFVPYTTGSKRGLDTRVSLKQALSALGFKGGTRRETELNQWVVYEKEQLAAVMLEYGIEWDKKGTHEKHLSVLDFEKKERAKEVAKLEQSISDGKERLSDIQIQQKKAEQETEQIRQEAEAIRQEVSELSETGNLLKEQTATLTEDKGKLLSDNEKLEKQQKKLQQEIEKIVQSKVVMERNIHAYDEDERWQLPEPGALMSAKAYKDKKAMPLVEKLKEAIKALTIKCVQLAEQGKKLKERITRQEQQISRLTNKVMEQSSTIDRLQEKAVDLGRLERYFGREAGALGTEEGKEMLFWTKEEYKLFAEEMMDKPLSYYAFQLLYWCGIRSGELLALTPADFNFKKKTLRINKSYQRLQGKDVITTPKTKNSIRTVVMPQFLCDEMQDCLKLYYSLKPDDRIFPVTKYYLNHEMERGCKACGVKKIRVHDLRHSHVSLLINMGYTALAIGKRVGHSAEKITYRYAHLFPSVQLDMAEQLDAENMKEEPNEMEGGFANVS